MKSNEFHNKQFEYSFFLELAGIGETLGKRLEAAGFDKVNNILKILMDVLIKLL